MTKTIRVIFVLMMFAVPTGLISQTKLTGTVTDAETKKPLPFTNIQIEGTYYGTSSNDAGEYNLAIKHVPATLLVRYIGYESQRIEIPEIGDRTINIALKPVVLEMDAVVVTGEDPAVVIMREVIKRKKEWRAKLESYKASAYSRGVIENDTSIVYIMENTSDVFWDKKKGAREVVTSRKKTQNMPDSWAQVAAIYFPNSYDDNILIQGSNVIGPTHPDALDHYNFTLQGQRALDDQIVFDISVTPKSKLQPTFTGTISVLDEEYAMIDVDLKTSKSVLLPFPIQERDMRLQQQFSNFGKDYWLPVDVRTSGFIKVGMIGLSFPTMYYRWMSRVTDYQINVALPDSLYDKKNAITIDSTAIKYDSVLVAENKVIPLNEREQAAYEKIDSTYTIGKAFKPSGPLARFVNMDEDSDNEVKSKRFSLDWAPDVRVNRVDAGHLGLRLNAGKRRFSGGGYIGYKTATKKIGYDSWLRAGLPGNTHVALSYLSDSVTRYGSSQYSMLVNSVWMLQAKDDYFDYYWTKKLRAELGFRPRKTLLSFILGVQSEKQTSLPKRTDFNIVWSDHVQRPNPAIEEGNLRSVEFKASYGNLDDLLGLAERKAIELTIEHSSPDFLSSDFSFTRYEATIDWRVTTFLGRRLMPNVLDFRISAGTRSGNLPTQRFGAIDSRLGALSPFAALRTLDHPYQGDRHFAIFWEHNFRTVPFEMIGWRAPVRHNIGIILHGASGRAWLPQEFTNSGAFPQAMNDGFHHEIGLSVNGLLGFFRLDVTRRLDKAGLFVGLGFARFF